MPELPEVETVCRTLGPVLTGKSFVAFELLWPRTLAHPNEETFRRRIEGQTISRLHRRAKLIVIDVSGGGALTVHLRMTGELLYRASNSEPDEYSEIPHLRATFLFGDGSELLFRDVRKFGRIAYLTPGELSVVTDSFGVEPLDETFTPDWLARNLALRKRQLKPLLLDQTFIAGLGNIYVDESLFLAGLHPLTRSDLVTAGQAETLHAAVVGVLTGAIERRGTTLRDYRSGLGESGENQSRLLVYGSRPGSPCPRCGTGLERLMVGQRGSIYCPACQPLIAPTSMRNR